MTRSGRARMGTCGWVVLTAVLFALGGCSESDDGSGGGTPQPTSPPASTSTPALNDTPQSTPTGDAATATPTPTVAPVDIAGTYSATIDLDDGQEAHLNLSIASDGQAVGTLEIIGASAAVLRTSHAAVAQTVAVSVGLVSVSGSVDAGSGSFHFSGTITTPTGPIPFDISGTLPRSAGESGSVALVVDGESYTSFISRSVGPTPLPTQPGATPTPSDGCGGGSGDVTFSNVAGVNANQPLDTLHLAEAEGTHSIISIVPLFVFGGKGAGCPVPVNGVARLIGFSLTRNTDYVAGDSLTLGPVVVGQPSATVSYSEATGAASLQTWTAQSGTLTIESVVGDRFSISITDAQMVPGAPFPFGPPATGTFTLDATLTIDAVTRNAN